MVPLPLQHLTGELHFLHYQAPPGRVHQPRTIEAGIEEIEVIVAGRGHFRVEGRPVDAGPGSLLWYCPDDIVAVTAHDRDPYETIVFRFGVTAKPGWGPPPFSRWADAGDCARFCRRALELSRLGTDRSPEYVWSHYARLHWEARDDRRRASDEDLPPALRRALATIEARHLQPIDVAAIASAAGMSAPHLHLLFRRHLGSSPLQALLARRLQRAQDELSRGRKSIKEICFAAGFSDFPYFCARFRRHTGLTPRQYRQRFAAM